MGLGSLWVLTFADAWLDSYHVLGQPHQSVSWAGLQHAARRSLSNSPAEESEAYTQRLLGASASNRRPWPPLTMQRRRDAPLCPENDGWYSRVGYTSGPQHRLRPWLSDLSHGQRLQHLTCATHRGPWDFAGCLLRWLCWLFPWIEHPLLLRNPSSALAAAPITAAHNKQLSRVTQPRQTR